MTISGEDISNASGSTILSDGYRMMYNFYYQDDTTDQPLLIVTPSTQAYRNSTAVIPSNGFLAGGSPGNSIVENLLANGYAILGYDVRGQATNWDSAIQDAGGGDENSWYHADNTQYPLSAEFGGESFNCRELLDIYELRSYILDAHADKLDSSKVGAFGTSLGGCCSMLAGAFSGKPIPYSSITSSIDNLLESSGNNYGDLPGYNPTTPGNFPWPGTDPDRPTWADYDSADSSSFPEFQAIATQSQTADMPHLLAPDGVRCGWVTGLVRLLQSTTVAPREVSGPVGFDKLWKSMATGDMTTFNRHWEYTNPWREYMESQTVPMLLQFSYGDRQKSIDNALRWAAQYKGPKYLNATTGHHTAEAVQVETSHQTQLIVQFFNKHIKGDPTAFHPTTNYRFMKTPEVYEDYRNSEFIPDALHLNTSSHPEETPVTYALITSGGANHLVRKDPSVLSATAPDVSASVKQVLNIGGAGDGLDGATDRGTSALMDRMAANRTGPNSDFSRVLFLDTGRGISDSYPWFNTSSYEFFSEVLSEDVTILGPVSGNFVVSSTDASSQFGYDVLDYDPSYNKFLYQSSSWQGDTNGVVTETINPRSIALGCQSFHNETDSSSITVNSGFQYYTFKKGHKIGIRLKNHTYFGPPITESDKSTFYVMPIIDDFEINFILNEAQCYVTFPVIPEKVTPPQTFKGGGWPRMRDNPLV
tara:strand:+ start:943 stop:3051 length:2109 start_codon:yes stop_codon:yes gene_type:complete